MPTPPPLSVSLNAVLKDFATLPDAASIAALDGAQVLLERMLRTGAKWRDGCSPNGACRFVRTADGVLAVNLPRALRLGVARGLARIRRRLRLVVAAADRGGAQPRFQAAGRSRPPARSRRRGDGQRL